VGRILFTSESHAGLFYPLVAIAGELADRGAEDLWFGCTDDREADVAAMGGSPRFVSRGPGPHADLQPTEWSDETYDLVNNSSRSRSLVAFFELLFDPEHGERMYQRTLEVIDQVRPDLMVIDSADFTALDAAMNRNIPYVMNSAAPVSYLFATRVPSGFPGMLSGLPLRMTWRQRWENRVFKVLPKLMMIGKPAFLKRMVAHQRRRQELGMKNLKVVHTVYADGAAAILGNTVFGIEYPFPAPSSVHMLGTMVRPPGQASGTDADLFDWLDRRESVVYIGLGSLMRVSAATAAEMVAAIERLDPEHHFLWSMTKAQQALLPDVLPANLRVESWVPQVEVLAHPNVRVYWAHGGNSSHHGLRFGKPLLLTPRSWETRDLAVRLADAGGALMVEDVRSVGRDELVDKLRRLLTDERLRERAVHWGRELAAAGGVGAAADLISAVLEGEQCAIG
jgi:polyene glycosyltransferase